jgi:hypothetical protein
LECNEAVNVRQFVGFCVGSQEECILCWYSRRENRWFEPGSQMYDSICELPSAAQPKGKDSYRYELFSHGLCGQLGLDECVCVLWDRTIAVNGFEITFCSSSERRKWDGGGLHCEFAVFILTNFLITGKQSTPKLG